MDNNALNSRVVDIVVPTHGRPDLLSKLLESLVPQVRATADVGVIIVNDGTHNAAYEHLIGRYGSMIDYVPLDCSAGPANARNVGAWRSKALYVAFLDDDCVTPPHWLNWLLALIESMPEVDVFGGPTRPPSPNSPKAVERFNRAFGFYPRPLFSKGRLYCLPSANVAIRRTPFLRIDGFDTSFKYAAGEDLNLFYRLEKTGSAIHIDYVWFVFHPVSDSLKNFIKRWYRYGYGTAQHIIRSRDSHDFGLGRKLTYLSIIKELVAHIRFMRLLLNERVTNDWIHIENEEWHWEPLFFSTLAGARHLAYRLGGAHAFTKED